MHRSWLVVAVGATATIIALGAGLFVWGLAVPREAVCPADYPGSSACDAAAREAAGVLWTVLIGIVYLATMVLAVTVGRRRPWLSIPMLPVLALTALIGYTAVNVSTGFLVG